MTTLDRSDINRANAQYSTGPKTPDGKKRSSLNALRHGLTGQTVVMPTEDIEAYQSHLKSCVEEYNPQGFTETNLVQSLADASWRLNRIAALEANLMLQGDISIAELATLSMHSQRLSRQFERTENHLRELQDIRRTREDSVLSDLLDIIEMYEAKEETYLPSTDGFVFSEPQIAAAQQARTRERRALEAYEYREEAA